MSTTTSEYPVNDARHHTMKISAEMRHLVAHLRGDAAKVQQPKAQAMYETAAEVIEGLCTAFEHYDKGTEAAMKEHTAPRAY
jgi:hypothetical protein